jgi:aspartyl-tRNA synthetase
LINLINQNMTEQSPQFYHIANLDLDILDDIYLDDGADVFVTIQGSIQHHRKQGNMLFLIVRERNEFVQVIIFKKQVGTEVFKDLQKLGRETVIQITGKFKQTDMLIQTTNQYYEIHATQVNVVSLAQQLPFQVEDLNQAVADRKGKPTVSLQHRLDMRSLDLRSQPSQLIFEMRSRMEHIIRDFFQKNSFTEIHTPKLCAIPSESGADVFSVKYFDEPAYLAQSPQLFKQMAINGGMGRVFEIGAVYRAERSFSRRHLCEFTGLDFEMELKPVNDQPLHYQVFNMANHLFLYLSRQMSQYEDKLNQLQQFYPGESPKIPCPIPILSFEQGVEMLQAVGVEQEQGNDLNHEAERRLGELVLEKYGSDLFFLEKYPCHLRPFYTMTNPENPAITNSYDLIFRGQEIASGAQREHRVEVLEERMKVAGLTVEHYQDYLNSFRYGAHPHGGIGIGLERLIALYLNVPDVHEVSLFPRDPERLRP